MIKDIRTLLDEHPVFGGLRVDLLDLMAGCGQNVRFEAGSRILREGQPADRFYLLRSGKAALEIDVAGRGAVVIETIGPGEVLGVSWPFPPHRWAFDATAVEPTAAIAMDAVCLRDKCDEDHELGYQVFNRFALLMRDRLQATRLQLLDVYSSHAR